MASGRGGSAHGAVKAARAHVAGGLRFVADLDLERVFGRVDHDALMARVARKVEDKRVLRLIRGYLRAGLMLGGIEMMRQEGTPQGGPLSPLLSNILLDDTPVPVLEPGRGKTRPGGRGPIYGQSAMGALMPTWRRRASATLQP